MAEYTPKHKNMEWQNIPPNTITRRNIPPNTKTRNGRIYPQTLKQGMAEYTPKHKNMEWQNIHPNTKTRRMVEYIPKH